MGGGPSCEKGYVADDKGKCVPEFCWDGEHCTPTPFTGGTYSIHADAKTEGHIALPQMYLSEGRLPDAIHWSFEGADSGLKCGAGTKASGGACLPADPVLKCGAGTEASGGACLPADSVCGAGTSMKDGKCAKDAASKPAPQTCWTNGNCSGFLGLDPCEGGNGVGAGQDMCTYCPGAAQKCDVSVRQ